MSLYRAAAQDGIAWVTGASTGIGRQVSLDLAREGYTVAATARGADKLASLVAEAADLGGRVVPFPGDVTDRDAMAQVVGAIETELGPIVLAVLSAGTYVPARGDQLDPATFVRTFETNVFGVFHSLVPLVARLQQRDRGQVAIVGSVTAYGGLPTAAAYGASKAALNNMAESLKFDFDRMNIRIQMINPGFVATPLTAKNKFVMPALMSVEDASLRILRGLKSGGFEITFPRRFTYVLKLINLLPHGLYFPLMSRAMGWRKRPARR